MGAADCKALGVQVLHAGSGSIFLRAAQEIEQELQKDELEVRQQMHAKYNGKLLYVVKTSQNLHI